MHERGPALDGWTPPPWPGLIGLIGRYVKVEPLPLITIPRIEFDQPSDPPGAHAL